MVFGVRSISFTFGVRALVSFIASVIVFSWSVLLLFFVFEESSEKWILGVSLVNLWSGAISSLEFGGEVVLLAGGDKFVNEVSEELDFLGLLFNCTRDLDVFLKDWARLEVGVSARSVVINSAEIEAWAPATIFSLVNADEEQKELTAVKSGERVTHLDLGKGGVVKFLEEALLGYGWIDLPLRLLLRRGRRGGRISYFWFFLVKLGFNGLSASRLFKQLAHYS